ncbi:MAG TPA: hypothetical protein VGC13_06660 [Longimicrobium sp.]|jgi:hypothetical protein|uniref:hypothetical protein n=1 Tax=Longimicrobium sp. TaxID=2029185 RepID=UPI002ED8C09E
METTRADAPAPERIQAPPAPIVTGPETSIHEPAVRPWELELLISGAVVFSLLQMPGVVDGIFNHAQPHLAGRAHLGAFMMYTYVKIALYTLISCFILHLGMRAYWVGLIGLETVFPHGVRWEDSSYGPVMTEVYRKKLGRLQPRIDAADRFCSILFPLAFTLVMLCVYSTAMIAIVAALAFGVSRLLLNGEHFMRVSAVIFLLAFLLPLTAWALDKAIGGRVRPGDRGERVIRRLSLASYYVNAMPAYGTVFMTLFTNARKGARYPVMYALMAVLFGFFITKDVFLGRGVLLAADHLYLPDDPGKFGVGAEYYESQREPGAVYDRTPSIQSDIVRDPYIKLFIPYTPVRHGEAFVEGCPDAPRLSRGGLRMNVDEPPPAAQVRAVLECWTRLQPVTLNGRPLRPDFRFYTHPESGLRGIMAYIPAAGLPRGENLLTVGVSPRDLDDQRIRDRVRGTPQEPHYIPFWL